LIIGTDFVSFTESVPMAVPQKIIKHPQTGQAIRFLRTTKDTKGALLLMESSFARRSKEPPPHYHPHQEEWFTVTRGSISVRMNGEVKIYRQGSSFHVPANTVHSMWNHSNDMAIVNWKVSPAMNTEYLFETVIGLAREGRTNEKGQPPLLQASLIMNRYRNEFRLAKPSYPLQRVVFGLLSPVALLMGYRSRYDDFLD
jgi:quercetin dioxygenase-like cupin family protein